MKARQLLCVHTWAEGLTAMEEETCACSRCGLPYETWCVRARAVRIGLLLATLIPATLAERIQAQPWHAVAITVATACGVPARGDVSVTVPNYLGGITCQNQKSQQRSITLTRFSERFAS